MKFIRWTRFCACICLTERRYELPEFQKQGMWVVEVTQVAEGTRVAHPGKPFFLSFSLFLSNLRWYVLRVLLVRLSLLFRCICSPALPWLVVVMGF
jgi:hypothetical protein